MITDRRLRYLTKDDVRIPQNRIVKGSVLSEQIINAFFQWKYDTALVFVRITRDVAATCTAIAVPLGAAATVVASWALLRRNGLRLVRR